MTLKEEREYINKELLSLAPRLASLERTNLFRVPDGYFSDLESAVLIRLNDLISSEEASVNHLDDLNDSLEIPDGYFNKLQDTILDRIADEEIEHLPDRLKSFRRENPFRVPDQYFEKLSDQIVSQLDQSSSSYGGGRIFRLFNPKLGLIAAALTGIIFTVFLLRGPNDSQEVVEINQDDVIEYLAEHIDEFGEDELIPLVNEEKLGEFDWIDVPNDDIQQYLTDEEIDLDLNEIL